MNRKNAFTLTEVIIVLVILGALALILIPNMANMMPDEHNIKYKKAFYTIQEIISDMANDPSVCQGLVNTAGNGANPNWVSPNNPDEILTMCYVIDSSNAANNRSRNLAEEICNRLSTTGDCSTISNITNATVNSNQAQSVLTTNGMRWNLSSRSAAAAINPKFDGGGATNLSLGANAAANTRKIFTILVDVDGCGSNNTFNYNAFAANTCNLNNLDANNGVYRITIRSDGKVFPGTINGANEPEDNLLLDAADN